MAPERQMNLCDLPNEVNAKIFSSLLPVGSVIRMRELNELINTNSIAFLMKEWADERARVLKRVTEIDATNPFQNVRCVQASHPFLCIEKSENHSVLSSESEESYLMRESLASVLVLLIKYAGKELKTIKLPSLYGVQTSIFESLIQCCPNLSEIHVTDLSLSSCRNPLAELVRDSNNLRRFVCDYPSRTILNALCSTESKIEMLELSNVHIFLVDGLADAVESHSNTLKSLIVHRIGCYGQILEADDSSPYLRAGLRAENFFVQFLNAKEFPKLKILKLNTLGSSGQLGARFNRMERRAQEKEVILLQKFGTIDECELNITEDFSWRCKDRCVIDLDLEDFAKTADALHNRLGLRDAEDRYDDSSVCSEEDAYPEFDLDQDDYENAGLSMKENLLCRPSNYHALRSIFVDLNEVLPYFFGSKLFRRDLRKILFAEASSLQYVAFSDERQEYQTAYSRLCRLMKCVLFYSKYVSHLRIPSLVVEKLDGQSSLPHLQYLRTVFWHVRNLKNLQIVSPYLAFENSGIDKHQRVGDFLRNWPMFLKQTARAMPQLQEICVLFEVKRSEVFPKRLENVLLDAMKATKNFEDRHRRVEVSEVKALFEMWLNEIRRSG